MSEEPLDPRPKRRVLALVTLCEVENLPPWVAVVGFCLTNGWMIDGKDECERGVVLGCQ